MLDAGFRLDALCEPEPPEDYVEVAHERWNVAERPQVLVVRAVVPADCR